MHGKKRKPSGGADQSPSKKPCPTPVPCQHGVLPKQFRDFFCARAFDIISDNRYRKHMVKCKESGDVWALELQASISAIQQRIRRIHALLTGTKGLQQSMLGRVCREASSARASACCLCPPPLVFIGPFHGNDLRANVPRLQVIGGTLPPTRVREGWSTCIITGVRAESCIEICKGPLRCPPGPSGVPTDHTAGVVPLCNPGGRGPAPRACAQQDVLVHRRFGHFFLMMWFVVKIEHIIRNHTRCWLDEQEPDQAVGALCSLFERQDQLFCKMHGVFEHAYEHVTNSLQRFIVEQRDRFQPCA